MSSIHIYSVRPRTDGPPRWDASIDIDGRIYRVGYCAGWVEETPESVTEVYGLHAVEYRLQAQEERRRFSRKYHFEGHDTPEEARSCFLEYLLDQETTFTPIPALLYLPTPRPCVVQGCNLLAEVRADVASLTTMFFLCQGHATREDVRSLAQPSVLLEPYCTGH